MRGVLARCDGKGTDRVPIPDDWYRIGKRTSGLNFKASNRNATHPVNAILNYGYAMLENQVRMHVVARGLDQASGILHGNGRDNQSLVVDLMEPLRPIVDRKVLEFVQQHIFAPGDFTLLEQWRLPPESTTGPKCRSRNRCFRECREIRGPICGSVKSTLKNWETKMDTIKYLAHIIWRIGFFPFAITGLLITVGFRGAVSIAGCGLMLFALRYVRVS